MDKKKMKMGLIEKFIVERVDGKTKPGQKHERCNYFVLDLTCDPFAKKAIEAYAEACKAKYPYLAKDLLQKVNLEKGMATATYPSTGTATYPSGGV